MITAAKNKRKKKKEELPPVKQHPELSAGRKRAMLSNRYNSGVKTK